MPQANTDPEPLNRGAVHTRIATDADVDGLTATLTAAFQTDPLWGRWAFADAKDLAVWWRFYIGSALRYPCVWVRGDYAAVSVWIPPDGTELTEEEEERLEPLLDQLVGPRAPDIMKLVERFEASHPREMSALLPRPAWNPSRLSRTGARDSAFSTRIWRAWMPKGYRRTWSRPTRTTTLATSGWDSREVGEFTTPDGKRTVATMWRDVERPQAAGLSE